MKREIKFRAWDTKVKTMTYDCKRLPPFKCNENKEIWIMMQFTGLFDKQKKEIYEGDIVKYKFGDTNYWKVTWNRLHCTFEFTDLKDEYSTEFMGGGECELEVIGNIYENEDLLK